MRWFVIPAKEGISLIHTRRQRDPSLRRDDIPKSMKIFLVISFFLHAALFFPFAIRRGDDSFQWGGGRKSPNNSVLHVVVDFAQRGEGGKLFIEKGADDLILFGKERKESGGSTAYLATSGLGISPSPAGGSGEGYDGTAASEGRENLLAAIRQQILLQKHYPLVAMREGIEGTVEVTFRMEEDGDLRDLSVVRSSGHDLLDDEAVATVSRAQPFPYVGGDIRIALEYSLEN